MMTRLRLPLLLLSFLLATNMLHAQFFIGSGGSLYISSGDTVSTQESAITSNVSVTGSGIFACNAASTQTLAMNGFSLPYLQIDNSNGVTLASAANLSNGLVFTVGAVTIGNNNLSFSPGATISGYAQGKQIATNGSGVVIDSTLAANTSFTFPVGNSSSSYSPLSVTNGSAAQTIYVAVQDYSTSAATEGGAANGMNRSWLLYTSAGGALSSLSLTHDSTLDGGNYYSAGAYITREQTTAGVWSNPNSTSFGGIVAPSGETGSMPTLTSASDTYYTNSTVLGSTATTSSDLSAWFSKASRGIGLTSPSVAINLNVKALLQGAFNTSTGLMKNTLQTSSLLPTNSTVAYSSVPRVDYANVNNTGGVAGSITDWIEVQLRDATNPSTTVVEQQSFLVQPNGQVVNESGGTTLSFASLPGNYYVAVFHRNHLPIRTSSSQSFASGGLVTYDFTTAQTQAYQNPAVTTNAAMAVSGSTYLMWGGDANANQKVSYTGLNNDYNYITNTVLGNNPSTPLLNVYNPADLNLDGKVNVSGLNNDGNFLSNTVLGNVLTLTLTKHL